MFEELCRTFSDSRRRAKINAAPSFCSTVRKRSSSSSWMLLCVNMKCFARSKAGVWLLMYWRSLVYSTIVVEKQKNVIWSSLSYQNWPILLCVSQNILIFFFQIFKRMLRSTRFGLPVFRKYRFLGNLCERFDYAKWDWKVRESVQSKHSFSNPFRIFPAIARNLNHSSRHRKSTIFRLAFNLQIQLFRS